MDEPAHHRAFGLGVSSPLLLLGAVFVAHLLAMISPGANVLLVAHTALERGRRMGVYVAMGVASGAALWCVAVLAGLSLVLARWPGVALLLRLAGAAWLIVIGVRMWLGATSAARRASADLPRSAWQAFMRGLLTNLSNPKALLFYGSVFSGLMAPALPGWVRAAAVAIVSIDSLLWHFALAWFFATPVARRGYERAQVVVDRCAGVVLVALGLGFGLSAG